MSLLDPLGAVRRKVAIGAALLGSVLLLGLLAWALRLDGLRGDWKDKFDALTEQASTVLLATRGAAENPELEWEQAAGQIVALGESNRTLKGSVENQNRRIDEMAADAVRLKAEAAELKRIADKAMAQRQAALDRLSDMAITPGTREDCMILLKEAEAALDLVREAGA